MIQDLRNVSMMLWSFFCPEDGQNGCRIIPANPESSGRFKRGLMNISMGALMAGQGRNLRLLRGQTVDDLRQVNKVADNSNFGIRIFTNQGG
jgi:hypothetical protein